MAITKVSKTFISGSNPDEPAHRDIFRKEGD